MAQKLTRTHAKTANGLQTIDLRSKIFALTWRRLFAALNPRLLEILLKFCRRFFFELLNFAEILSLIFFELLNFAEILSLIFFELLNFTEILSIKKPQNFFLKADTTFTTCQREFKFDIQNCIVLLRSSYDAWCL
jgi:hypothetical protein